MVSVVLDSFLKEEFPESQRPLPVGFLVSAAHSIPVDHSLKQPLLQARCLSAPSVETPERADEQDQRLAEPGREGCAVEGEDRD